MSQVGRVVRPAGPFETRPTFTRSHHATAACALKALNPNGRVCGASIFRSSSLLPSNCARYALVVPVVCGLPITGGGLRREVSRRSQTVTRPPARSSQGYNLQVFPTCVFGLGGYASRSTLTTTLSSARELLWRSRKLGTIARCCRARRQAFLLRGRLARAYPTARSQRALGGADHHDSPHPCLWSRPTKVHRFPSGRGKYSVQAALILALPAHAPDRFKTTQNWDGF